MPVSQSNETIRQFETKIKEHELLYRQLEDKYKALVKGKDLNFISFFIDYFVYFCITNISFEFMSYILLNYLVCLTNKANLFLK